MNVVSTVQQRITHTKVPPPSTLSRRLDNEPSSSGPTTAELWQWTFKREAISTCFVKDIFDMKESRDKQNDFFWLGRVPCRTVRILGLVVGVQVYEKRIRYTVDDGTSVIDCMYRQPALPRAPTKKGQEKASTLGAHPQLKPLAHVGSLVCVVGRVVRKYETREIVIDSMTLCPSANDEPRHWRAVRALHRSYYDLDTPFVIPEPAISTTPPPSPVNASLALLNTPNKVLLNKTLLIKAPSTTTTLDHGKTIGPSTPSTVFSTPASSSVTSSPAISGGVQSPQKLRHPSRLHSRDLTGNAFRIYVKYFMDHDSHSSRPVLIKDDDGSDTDDDLQVFSTPTKFPHSRSNGDKTPRQQPLGILANKTPRPTPRIPALSFDGLKAPDSPLFNTDEPSMYGFTLSYLRRVPVLADMARRVVSAEARRRIREERKKDKDVRSVSVNKSAKGSTSTPISTSVSRSQADEEKLASRVKRLFQWAIVKLLHDGSIVLWDGPVRPLSVTAQDDSKSSLWKANISSRFNSTVGADSSVFSAPNGISRIMTVEDDEVVVSDPEEGEEAYVPMSPRYLAGFVENAIKVINQKGETAGRRGRVGEGATKEAVLAFLRRDDRWRYVGEWSVIEAMEVLRMEKRAWCVGKGKWELSI